MYWLDRSGNQRCPWSPYAARSCQDNCPHQSAHFVHQRSTARTIQVSADHSIRYRTKRKAQSTLHAGHPEHLANCTRTKRWLAQSRSRQCVHTPIWAHIAHSAHIARIAAAPTPPKCSTQLHTFHYCMLKQ